ncbi:HlyD family secretion protein [Paludibacterium paludis]|uniref:CzcB-like barrel-sandwich hybrid domain-containing protein n=1 Tax=Paludibacterium paludis TaxID=1225769 RepID=A0A918U9X2_9NEIS|nr:efflux RND transporter periplasmic adaptor subunit [Paludibacterium paludis]GGY14716.1 hypothetical protein GCM10011289_17570 [Paludibacterium paludis]
MNTQTFIHPLSAAVLVAVLLTGCSEPEKTKAPIVSPWAAVAKGSVSIEGGIINIAAPRPGIVRQVEVEEGAEVKTGQVLARIDDREAMLAHKVREREQQAAREELKLAQTKLAIAQRELRRVESLPGDDEVSRQDKDNARDQVNLAISELDKQKAALTVADAQMAASQLEVERHVVRAPQDGRIIRRQAKPGDGTSTLNVTPLFQFAPNGPRIIRADLEERFVNSVQPGQAAEVTLEADDKKTYKARVLRLGQVFGNRPETDDPNEKQDMRIIECVLSVEAPQLRIGQRVIVRIVRQDGAGKS